MKGRGGHGIVKGRGGHGSEGQGRSDMHARITTMY